ncbi:MAG: peptidylprolyl isomerase [Myxococcota bacterium]
MPLALRGLSLVVVLSACSDAPGALDPRRSVAVEVRGSDFTYALTRGDVSEALARAHLESDRGAPALEPEAKRAVLEGLIDERLALREARVETSTTTWWAVEREHIRADLRLQPGALAAQHRSEEDLRQAVAHRLAWSALVAERVDTSTPSEAVLRRLWQDESPHGERVRAGQIVVETKEAARSLRRELANGGDFRALARAHSVAPEGIRGGDLGWFERGDMPHVFEEACFALAPGDTSPVVASTYGYHVFRVYERAPAGREAYATARPRLIRTLRAQRRAEAERELRVELRDRVQVRYVAEVLRPLGVPLSAEEIENR